MFDPALVSSDVFGTLLDVRAGSYAAFERILARAGGAHVDVKAFWEAWEHANIRRYREPYRSYKAICADSLAETLAAHGLDATRAPALIGEYFASFEGMPLYPDVAAALARLAGRRALAVVSNIDDDLFAATRVAEEFDFAIVVTAERARLQAQRRVVPSPDRRGGKARHRARRDPAYGPIAIHRHGGRQAAGLARGVDQPARRGAVARRAETRLDFPGYRLGRGLAGRVQNLSSTRGAAPASVSTTGRHS
jgi:phosphoglycolate phosphatase-like HAD superfamily hydrolase